MTPAELKTLREACGLTLPQLGALSGVQERTARYWESGKSRIPADVSQRIKQLDDSLSHAAGQAVQQLTAQAAALPDGATLDTVLLRYRTDAELHNYRPDMYPFPAATHAALLYRVRDAAAEAGITCRIIYMDPPRYESWRSRQDMPDDEATRAAWAAVQPV